MERTFKYRVNEFWREFSNQEGEIRRLIDEQTDLQMLVSRMKSLVDLAFNDANFEIGRKEKYELTLTPEGDRSKLFLIEYWRRCAPNELASNWNFYSSKQAIGKGRDIELKIYGMDIGKDDYLICPKVDEDRHKVDLEVFSPKLMNIDEDKRYSVVFISLDQYIGELYVMEHIGKVDFVDDLSSDGITMGDLKERIDSLIEEMRWGRCEDPCQCFTSYKMKPNLTSRWDFREDVLVGTTSCIQVLNDYYFNSSDHFDSAFENGAIYGFIFYDNTTVPRNEVVTLRADIEDDLSVRLSNRTDADVIGGATGLHYSYIDFIVYDMSSFMQTVDLVLSEYPVLSYGFSEFKRGGKVVRLKGTGSDILN